VMAEGMVVGWGRESELAWVVRTERVRELAWAAVSAAPKEVGLGLGTDAGLEAGSAAGWEQGSAPEWAVESVLGWVWEWGRVMATGSALRSAV